MESACSLICFFFSPFFLVKLSHLYILCFVFVHGALVTSLIFVFILLVFFFGWLVGFPCRWLLSFYDRRLGMTDSLFGIGSLHFFLFSEQREGGRAIALLLTLSFFLILIFYSSHRESLLFFFIVKS